MALNLKPRREDQEEQSSHKEGAMLAAQEPDTVKTSVDIEEDLYYKMMDLKMRLSRQNKRKVTCRDIINDALKQYLNSHS